MFRDFARGDLAGVLAATEPVVLLIEDAQYADPDLLDFLDHLIDWVSDRPV